MHVCYPPQPPGLWSLWVTGTLMELWDGRMQSVGRCVGNLQFSMHLSMLCR